MTRSPGAAQIALFADCSPVPAARSDDEEIARGVVAFVAWITSLVDAEDQAIRAAESRRSRIASMLRQVDLEDERWKPAKRVSASSLSCGQPRTCRRISCKWNATLDLGEPEVIDGFALRPITLNTGWREGAPRARGRRPAFGVEEQADRRNWQPFGEQVEAELDAMEDAGFDNCCDRAARRVSAAIEETEDVAVNGERQAALEALDHVTTVTIGLILGVSDESVRLASRSAEEKLRNMARSGGYREDGDVADLADAILFGAE